MLPDIEGECDALTGSFGVSGAAWTDAITGVIPARRRQPIELPRSMEAVRSAEVDERLGARERTQPLIGMSVSRNPSRPYWRVTVPPGSSPAMPRG